eukprot:TRINITY_DN7887_c0_g1_i1.p1 TRINITY_DN7887_c0_g1~~TRINITY_DN7887_c0_g1_i1.p1  ORF type:complete len:119 (+),score=15.98 TRINITY_DN7887_c0_g1_i1:43-357(+)
MTLPPLQATRGPPRRDPHEIFLDSDSNPQFADYGALSWEAIPTPITKDTGDLGVTTPQRQRSSPKKKKKVEGENRSNVVEAWHHDAGFYDEKSKRKQKGGSKTK